MSANKKSHRDKRVALLTKDSEKLREEITELEDALILHSRFQAEDDSSLRGIIRREVGGSRWEHGGEGKMRTYRGNSDLTHRSGTNRLHPKEKLHGHKKEFGATKATSSNNASSFKSTNSKAYKSTQHISSPSKKKSTSLSKKEKEEDGQTSLDITCLNGDWALRTEKHATRKDKKDIPINDENLSKISTLKDNIMAKVSAKVIDRGSFKSALKAKVMPSSAEASGLRVNKIDSMKSDRIKSGESSRNLVDSNYDKYGRDTDISYNLSFLESLDDSEATNTRVEKNEIVHHHNELDNRDATTSQEKDYKKTSFHAWGEGKKVDSVSKVNDEFNDSNRWATEREILAKDSECHLNLSKSQRRNSIGGNYPKAPEKSLKNGSNRQSHPVCENDTPFVNRDKTHKTHLSDFPDLISHTHKSSSRAYSIRNSGEQFSLQMSDEKENSDVIDDQETKLTDGLMPASSTTPPLACDKQVQSWLENQGLQSVDDYINIFANHEMDMSSVRLLSATRLREMGIHALGPIMKIMKGVQVLNRDATFKRDADEKDSDEISDDNDELRTHVSQSVAHSQDNEDKGGSKFPDSGEDKLENTKSVMSWEKTADEAEYTNLNDRSLKEGFDILHTVSVKDKSAGSGKEKKKMATSSTGKRKDKSGAKMEENCQERSQSSSKVIKKPPIVTNGLSSAHQKLKEKKKQEELQTKNEQVTSARHRHLRDKMAARHSSRRASSSERASLNTEQKCSLEKSMSFTNYEKLQEKVKPNSTVSEGMQELLETKALGITDRSKGNLTKEKENATGGEEDDVGVLEAKVRNLAAEKLDGDGNPDVHETLNLGVVRELQKQLNHIEQHLVKKLEKIAPTSTETVSDDNEEEEQRKMRDGNSRLSARERRRQRVPKPSPKDTEGLSEITHSFLKVERIYSQSHLSPKERKSVLENKEGLKNSSDTEDTLSISPKPESKKRFSEKSPDSVTEPNLSENTAEDFSRTEAAQSSQKSDRMSMNAHKKVQDLDFMDRASWGAKVARGKVGAAQEYLHKIEIDKNSVSFEKKDLLGDGAFSQVYKGNYQGSEVAIKQLKTSLTPVDKNYFLAEVSLLQELRHPHVVMLLGVCTAHTCPFLVLEFMQGGNLFNSLHDLNMPPLSRIDFFQISRDIASGICYLHSHRPPVLHLDLKSRNVLLGFGNRAKVADFGFSKLKHDSDMRMSRSSKSKLSQGSPAWMAPELLAAGEITPKADVYSFAVVLWEMLSREQPYFGCSTFQILEYVRTSQRPSIPHGCPQGLKQLVDRCWHQNPCTRPSFKEILPDLDVLSEGQVWSISPFQTKDISEEKNKQKSFETNTEDGIKETALTGSVSEYSGDHVSEHSSSQQDVRNENLEGKENNENLSQFEKEKEKEITQNTEIGEDKGAREELFDKILQEIGEDSDSKNFVKVSCNEKNKKKSEQETYTPPNKELPVSVSPIIIPTSGEIKTAAKENTRDMIDTDLKMESYKREIKTPDEDKKVSSSLSPNGSGHEPGMVSTTDMLLNSARDKNRLDDLMKQYLPSPRTKSQIRKPSTGSNDEVIKKLLPLRQSLDKPAKPPKPRISGKMPVSKSENFGMYGSKTDISMEETKENSNKTKLTPEINYNSPQQTSSNTSEMSRNDREMQPNVPDQRNSSKEKRDFHTSTSPRINTSDDGVMQRNLLDHRSSPKERVRDSQPLSSPAMYKGTDGLELGLTDGNRNHHNSSETNTRYEDVNESMQSVDMKDEEVIPFESPTKHYDNLPCPNREALEPHQIPCVKPSQHSLHSPDRDSKRGSNKKGVSFQVEKVPSLNLSTPEEKLDDQTAFDIRCDSSTSTDMSMDSLCESLSDDTDSIKRSFPHHSHKNKKQMVTQKKSQTTQQKSDKGLKFTSQRRIDTTDHAKPVGKVRESFFLFDDLHLDLDKLDQDGNDAKKFSQIHSVKTSCDETHWSKSKPVNLKGSKSNALSKSLKPSEGLFPLETHHMQKESVKASGFQSTGQQQLLNTQDKSHIEANPGLKEGILRVKAAMEKKASTIPPPPSLKGIQNRRNKDQLHPVMSGFPIKSSSSKPEIPSHSRFSVEPGLLLQQRQKLKSVLPSELTPLKETAHGRSMPSVASILKKAMDERRVALAADNQESQDGATPDASWSIQD